MHAIAALTIVLCFVWIACDPWMQEAFLVYGRAFRTAIDMKAWTIMWKCGWRLAIVIMTIALTFWLTIDATLFRAAATTSVSKVAWYMLLILSLMLVAWPFVVSSVRERRRADELALALTETVEQIAKANDLCKSFDLAGYENEGDWVAWHPKQEVFERTEESNIWRRIGPVVYTSPSRMKTIVIPIDFCNFCVWGSRPIFAKRNSYLPFHGPGATKFRTLSIRKPKIPIDCWVIHADIDVRADAPQSG